MNNISPNEIDKMADELYRAGYGSGPDEFHTYAMMLTRGAEFQSHLAHVGAEATGVAVNEQALAQRMRTPFDMVADAYYQRDLAAQHGEPVEGWDRFIAGLEDLQTRRHSQHQYEHTATQAMAVLIDAQEQRDGL
jgi:hypothetical protein